MRVIFLQRVPGKGDKGQVKEISDGYARNFLIPRGLAIAATADKLISIEREKKAQNAKEAEDAKRLNGFMQTMASRELVFDLKGDEHGSIFGSVNKDAIEKALRASGLLTHDRAEVLLDHPIKKFGEHEVHVRLSHGITGKVKVNVRRQP